MQFLYGKIAKSKRHRHTSIQAFNAPNRKDLLWWKKLKM